MKEFRLLKENEIEIRVKRVTDKGCQLLLYKDARVDMSILDETVGAMNWNRSHQFKDGKAYCTVSIWDEVKSQWVSKEDVGVESNTEAEKGEASDSFKRACVNWGIGRELYSSPFIWLEAAKTNIVMEKDKEGNNKLVVKDQFRVEKIAYDAGRNISGLAIVGKKGRVFLWQKA